MLCNSALYDLQCYKRMHAHQRRMIDEHVTASREYYPVNDLEELSAWLTGHMHNLHNLSLFVSYCPALPALQHLVHLEVNHLSF